LARQKSLESVFKVEPLTLEVGLGFAELVKGGRNSPLLRRIAGFGKHMAADAGF
jgi:flagellar biosynthesis component FlhA